MVAIVMPDIDDAVLAWYQARAYAADRSHKKQAMLDDLTAEAERRAEAECPTR